MVKRCGEAEMEIGDVVHLKSGGPTMTVEVITKETAVIRCVWFDNAELKRGIFPAATLKQAHDEDEDDDDDDEMGDHSRGFIGLRAKKPTSR
jgi:uncharacterized protein YodC (DUF2158 family)